MAINNNVQNIQFLRNQTPFETREAARQALVNNKGIAADGTALLARYTVSGEVKTIVGFVHVSGTTKSITIFDTEGAAADVEKLRQEINAKLGIGITSANTATEQLAALSGTSSDASGVTSVWGAKNYADALKDAMEYTGVTTGTGVYVTNVTEADGIVSATTATLPSVTNTKEAKKVVVSVSEDKGEISIERGTISSSAETMVLTDNTDGGVNFEVNIDGASIVQDPTSNKIKVADSALTQYFGDEKTIHAEVDAATNKKTFNTLLKIVKNDNPSETEVKEEYFLADADGNAITGADTIKIYKDSHIVSIKYITDSGDTEHYQNLEYKYIDVSGNTKTEYVDISSLVLEAEFASGLTIENHVARGVVDSTSENNSGGTAFLTVGANGFKVDGIKNEIINRINELDATVGTTDIATGKHVAVQVVEEDGKLTGLTVNEQNIADADDLATLSGKTFTVATSSNASITTGVTAAADGTKSVDLITDADKIKMSGFTADSASALSGIVTSDSIATAFEKTNAVITSNERVTAEALTDLDTRVDAIESGYVETVKVNNVALGETDNAVNIQISAATSAVTASGNEAIVVTTNNKGAITLGIASIDAGFYA